MFRGGDYYDDPKFQNPNQIRNTMDISDINGTSSKNYNQKGMRDNINVSDINGSKPPLPGLTGQRSSNVYGSGIGDGYTQQRQADQPIAGSRHRNQGNMSDIFSSQQQQAPQRIENRSLVTNDIAGASSQKRNYIVSDNVIAGVRNGSPARKNDSTVFSHHTDNNMFDRDSLKRKEIEINKPRVVQNNLSTGGKNYDDYYGQDYLQQQIQQSQGLQMAGILGGAGTGAGTPSAQQEYSAKDYQQEKSADDLERQYQEYMMLQQRQKQEAPLNYQQILQQQPVNGLSGFTKNQGGMSNILSHDITDVRAKGNLVNNGNQIFNSGGYSSSSVSRRTQKEQKFDQNFQKPMADRNNSGEYLNNNQMKTAAGVALSMNSTAKRVSVNDGKERLFGAVYDENTGGAVYQRQGSLSNNIGGQQQQPRTGKRILNSGGGMSGVMGNDSYSNVIAGSGYAPSIADSNSNPGYNNQRIVMMSHVPIPGANYGAQNDDPNNIYGSGIPMQEGY